MKKVSPKVIVACIICFVLGGVAVFWAMTRPAPAQNDQKTPAQQEIVEEPVKTPESEPAAAEEVSEPAGDTAIEPQDQDGSTNSAENVVEDEAEVPTYVEEDPYSLDGKVIIMINSYRGYAYTEDEAQRIYEGINPSDDDMWAEGFRAAYEGARYAPDGIGAIVYSSDESGFKFDGGGTAKVYILPDHIPEWGAVRELQSTCVAYEAYECSCGTFTTYIPAE